MNPSFSAVRERQLHQLFEVSVLLKAAGAILETLLGLALLYSANAVELVLTLINNALVDDPGDFFATHFQSVLNPSTDLVHFGGLYLLSHGLVKLFLIVGLLRDRLWAYPASIAVFGLFIVYQVVRFAYTHSPWLVVLTVFDVLVLWLIWHEYRHKSRAQIA